MNFFRNDPFSLHSSSSPSEEDILIKKITLTHDPDGRHLDSEQLLRAMQNVMCYTAASEVSSFQIDGIADNDVSNIEVVGAQESLSQIISKLSCEMLCKSSREVDMHARTMILFDLLGNYRWDAKVVLVLAAFATSYGRLWLIMQLYPHNPLAVSVAMLKQLPNDLSMFKPRFKALSLLVKTMVDVTKCIIKFEGLPFRHVKLDDEAMAITKSYIYISSYWVKRSTLACSFQITDLDMKPEQIGMSELKDKVVILLVSSPELLPLEEVFLLIHQTYDQPQHKKLEDSYEIVWVPISISGTWTDAEAERFNILCNSLPWYSIWRPWLLHSAVVNYIKQEWNFKDDPLMVVLDPRGMVTNSNAIDMVSIWGAKAFPFSSSREEQLWEEESWSLQFLVDDIDPLLTRWVEEDRNICIYGSDNLDWIREFNAKFETIRSSDVQLEMVYVGNKNLTELVRHTLAIIEKETHSSSLSFTKLQFFWLRLESMRRSKLRMGESISSEHIQKGVAALLDSTDEGWAVIGRGNTTDIVKVEGREMIECLNKFSEWGDNVAKLGFLGALRTALEPPSTLEPCNHIKILPYAEGLVEKIVACDKCKRPVKKYILYE
ncbi:conserved hypothetical protein [Ricinus communis]|uniref:Protein SIEVE ELEMENT OCCLUSION C n=1 Tax=Ricinus communis TaxID=3988 RepID=B9RMT3_RICCO|nr:conserved hypothetical protein [Ricinus communis]